MKWTPNQIERGHGSYRSDLQREVKRLQRELMDRDQLIAGLRGTIEKQSTTIAELKVSRQQYAQAAAANSAQLERCQALLRGLKGNGAASGVKSDLTERAAAAAAAAAGGKE